MRFFIDECFSPALRRASTIALLDSAIQWLEERSSGTARPEDLMVNHVLEIDRNARCLLFALPI